jgi:septal ring factor EnvC (AmiA/AmiB activator)
VNGTEFIAATAAILFMAFLAGWFTHWLISRITRVTRSDMDDLDKMAQELHHAEEERDQAVIYMQQREAELTNKMAQTEAELEAAMDGLRDARRETEELRTYIERANQAG